MKRIDYSVFDDHKEKYLEILDLKLLQKGWDILHSEIITRRPTCNIYPINVKDIIIADPRLLNTFYLDSINLTDDEKNASKCIFNYDYDSIKKISNISLSKIKKQIKHNQLIANFFIKNAELLKITSCYYCEMNYIFPYAKNSKSKRMFDLDHFFGKGESPITALSLYNLIPSCPICNSRIKGRKKMDNLYYLETKPAIKDYSDLIPSSQNYDFDKDVKIKIEPDSVGFISDIDKNSVIFETKSIYSREINAFDLEKRYNSIWIKKQALLLEELKQKWPLERIKDVAEYLKNKGENTTEIDIKRTIFHEDDDLDQNSIFSKLKRDILDL